MTVILLLDQIRWVQWIGVVKDLVVKCSDVLKTMLCDSEIKEPGDVIMPDVYPDAVNIFLKYAYGATDNSNVSDLGNWTAQTTLEVVDFAEKYNIAPLKQMAINQMEVQDVESVFSALHCITFYNATSLEPAVLEVLQKDLQNVLNHPSFLDIDVESLVHILKQDKLDVDELDLWKAALKWGKHREKNREGCQFKIYSG
uniref:BTB domain-containing protein n=1 Tax=Graphocephala atropunctata TaxID=36148 RepID=A0A1B6MJX4_9HEMI